MKMQSFSIQPPVSQTASEGYMKTKYTDSSSLYFHLSLSEAVKGKRAIVWQPPYFNISNSILYKL